MNNIRWLRHPMLAITHVFRPLAAFPDRGYSLCRDAHGLRFAAMTEDSAAPRCESCVEILSDPMSRTTYIND